MSGTVSGLEIQKKNKERVNVYLDGEFAFGLSLLEAVQLRKGQTLSESDIAALKARDETGRAYERAIQFLGPRPRSAAEIRGHLAEKEIDAAVIDAVITKLEGIGYVDDAAFANFWLSNRQEFHPEGERALRFELRQKGVESSVIDAALEASRETFEPSEAAYRAARDKARRYAGTDRRTFRTKLGSFLTRRGFDYAMTRSAIDRLIEELAASDARFFTEHDEQDEQDTDQE